MTLMKRIATLVLAAAMAVGTIPSAMADTVIPREDIQDDHSPLTLEKLQEICGDSLMLIMASDNEHVLFVAGHYSNVTVTSEESALNAVMQMKDLIGLPDDSVMVLTGENVDTEGKKYYQFTRDVNGYMDPTQTVVIGTDAEGQVVCITSSPFENFTDKVEDAVTFSEAETFFENLPASDDVIDCGRKTKHEYYEPIRSFVYSHIFQEENGRYLKILVPTNYPRNPIQFEHYISLEAAEDPAVGTYDYMFDASIPVEDMEFTDYYGNKVMLPVACEEGKEYYILDQKRHMVSILEEDSVYEETLLYFDDPSELSPIYVSGFHNMQLTFDAYEALGLYHNEKPILVHWFPDDTRDNISCDYYSDVININFKNHPNTSCLDLAGHELAHAIVFIRTTDFPYRDVTGTINESYADIFGNLMEMLLYEKGALPGVPVDTENWYIAESIGIQDGIEQRCMANPPVASQPTRVYDPFYVITNPEAGYYEDLGGLHTNSGVINNIAYRMYKEVGLSYEEIITIFYNIMPLLSYYTNYNMMAGFIEYSMQSSGYDAQTCSRVHELFEDSAAYRYDPNETWTTVTPNEGFYKLTFKMTDTDSCPDDQYAVIYFWSDDNSPYKLSRDTDNMLGTIVAPSTSVNYMNFFLPNLKTGYYISGNPAPEVKIVVEQDTELSINYRDMLSTVYAESIGTSQEAELLEHLVASAQDMIEVLLTASYAGPDNTVYVTNLNLDNDDIGVYYHCEFSSGESGDGYRLLLRKDASYNFGFTKKVDDQEIKFTDWNVMDHISDGDGYVIHLDECQHEGVAPLSLDEAESPSEE